MADYRSRLVDTNDWMLNTLVFSLVIARWGPFTIDRLADAQNAQIPKFNSRYWSPGTEVVDASW